ncbi:MFS general substrate transporter [Colletotrichum somersetense]|nr:MFS general substrate transporter [Colletotrichum somersetense]
MDDHISSEQEEDHPTKLAVTFIAAPDQSAESSVEVPDLHHYDDHKIGPTVTKKELYSYYTYYAGNNGIGSFQYSNLLFQNLIYQAGFNPNVLPLGSLTFLSQAFVFIGVGSLADYGNWNPWVVRIFSVICWAIEFGFLGVKEADQWRTAMALYILSAITFWASYVFFNAIFPKVAHDLPEVHKAHEDFLNRTISEVEYQHRCSMARSKVMNMSYGWNNVGFTACGALSLAALAGIGANDSVVQNNWGYSVSVSVCTGFWILLALPWFLCEKKRPGPPLPPGGNYLTFGFKQTWFAAKQVWALKQTFFYLIAFFLLADGIGTTIVLVGIAQTQVVAFSATQNTYLIMVQGGSCIVGVFGAYYVQQLFNLRTKSMLQAANIGCVLVALWGMIGIWTTKVGYHNIWEFWLFNAQFGFTMGAQFSYGQAFMAELVPHGREYLFFSLLGIVSKGSAWIGPIVSSAIVDVNNNDWTPFPFVAALILVPTIGIFFISETKSQKECAEYLIREATTLRKLDNEEEVDK